MTSADVQSFYQMKLGQIRAQMAADAASLAATTMTQAEYDARQLAMATAARSIVAAPFLDVRS